MWENKKKKRRKSLPSRPCLFIFPFPQPIPLTLLPFIRSPVLGSTQFWLDPLSSHIFPGYYFCTPDHSTGNKSQPASQWASDQEAKPAFARDLFVLRVDPINGQMVRVGVHILATKGKKGERHEYCTRNGIKKQKGVPENYQSLGRRPTGCLISFYSDLRRFSSLLIDPLLSEDRPLDGLPENPESGQLWMAMALFKKRRTVCVCKFVEVKPVFAFSQNA